jgi:hypothetical protein
MSFRGIAQMVGKRAKAAGLGDRKPRTRLERAVRDALRAARHARHPDVTRPPLPGHGIDGPDLGP